MALFLPIVIQSELKKLDEQAVTETLYKLYKEFRIHLHADLKATNRTIDTVVLYKKTQKLIDRFLFILFAEDKGLLPAFTVKTHINNWINTGRNGTVLQVFQELFKDLNTGNAAKNIFAYNGGLFAPDAVVDSLVLPVGNTLEVYLLLLEAFDYKTEVDVLILGHIFEQSLNDLDEMKALSAGEVLDKKATKRKKEGVFYTPQYITKYIIEETLGALCAEKRLELGIFDGKQTTAEVLAVYRNWLLTVTVVDPACGSGAFLSEVLTFFTNEHAAVDERLAGATNKPVLHKDYSALILQNNIFGVDLNEEAVEIAKLSLWLQTAKRGKPLSNLAQNIKVGNSLIDDKTVSPNAFNWQKEFPKVFSLPLLEATGFDIVVGNPPYVNARNMQEKDRTYLTATYAQLSGAWDLYVPFLLKGQTLSKRGIYGWIIPNKLLSSDYAAKTLDFLKQTGLTKIIDISHLPIFENVGVYPIILINNASNAPLTQYNIQVIEDLEDLQYSIVKANIFKRFNTIKGFGIGINSGTTGFEATKIIPLINEKKEGIDFAVSGSIDPYFMDRSIVPYMKKRYHFPSIRLDKTVLADSKIAFWNNPKIVIAGMTKRIEAFYSGSPLALGVGLYGIYDFAGFDPLFLLAVLNSKFLTYYLNIAFKDKHLAGGYLAINKSTIEALPLVKATEKQQQSLSNFAQTMLDLHQSLHETNAVIIDHLQEVFENELKITKKISTWQHLTWHKLLHELQLQKLTLLPQQAIATQRVFEEKKQFINNLQAEITKIDIEINRSVYALYELTDEEIALVTSI